MSVFALVAAQAPAEAKRRPLEPISIIFGLFVVLFCCFLVFVVFLVCLFVGWLFFFFN